MCEFVKGYQLFPQPSCHPTNPTRIQHVTLSSEALRDQQHVVDIVMRACLCKHRHQLCKAECDTEETSAHRLTGHGWSISNDIPFSIFPGKSLTKG